MPKAERGPVDERDRLADRFEEQRGQLLAVAYRMLGSGGEAEDAVQEAWLRLARVDSAEVDNLPAWLRTVVTRICLDMLRSRSTRYEDLTDQVPEDSVLADGHALSGNPARRDGDPEAEALLAAGSAGPEHVQADPRDDRGEPPLEGVDLFGVGPLQP